MKDASIMMCLFIIVSGNIFSQGNSEEIFRQINKERADRELKELTKNSNSFQTKTKLRDLSFESSKDPIKSLKKVDEEPKNQTISEWWQQEQKQKSELIRSNRLSRPIVDLSNIEKNIIGDCKVIKKIHSDKYLWLCTLTYSIGFKEVTKRIKIEEAPKLSPNIGTFKSAINSKPRMYYKDVKEKVLVETNRFVIVENLPFTPNQLDVAITRQIMSSTGYQNGMYTRNYTDQIIGYEGRIYLNKSFMWDGSEYEFQGNKFPLVKLITEIE